MKLAKKATSAEILDAAEALTQTRGFNGFSYADISEAVGITKASLHYHFRTKAELGRQLILRYSDNFGSALTVIGEEPIPALQKLRRYVDLYMGVVQGDRMCLCGMLAAEVTTLPEAMRQEVRMFFDLNEAWLAGVLERGRANGELRFEGTAVESARLLLDSLEGAMLVARSYGDPSRFEQAAARLLAQFTPD